MATPDKKKITSLIISKAKELGFSNCGFAKASVLDEDFERLNKWLEEGYQGEMSYMERNLDKRVSPELLHPGTISVISLLMPYKHWNDHPSEGALKISQYAAGKDYHLVVKERLHKLLVYIQSFEPDVSGRVFVDTAPVLEKVWAQKSGLGWIGKNTCLISKDSGSYVFIGELFINMELEYSESETNHCGSCTKCIEACPTGALSEPFILNATRCTSYLTIEHKGELSAMHLQNSKGWIFGCDICQSVCPWNKKPPISNIEDLKPNPDVIKWDTEMWKELTEEKFNEYFSGTPLERTGFQNFRRNINLTITSNPAFNKSDTPQDSL